MSSLSLLDLSQLPESERALLSLMRRKGTYQWSNLVTDTGQDVETLRSLLQTLIGKGFIQETTTGDDPSYRVNFGSRRGRTLPSKVNKALDKLL